MTLNEINEAKRRNVSEYCSSKTDHSRQRELDSEWQDLEDAEKYLKMTPSQQLCIVAQEIGRTDDT